MKRLDQEVIDRIALIQYDGIPLLRYVIDDLGVPTSGEEITRNATSSATEEIHIPRLPIRGKETIETFFESLSPREYLIQLLPLRKLKGTELYHEAADPYLDLLDTNRYIVIENSLGNEKAPVHTHNRHLFSAIQVLGAYGCMELDAERINCAIRELISTIEGYYGIRYQEDYCRKISNVIWNALELHQAFLQFYLDVIERVQPRLILYTHGAENRNCILYEAARASGVFAYEIDHGVNQYTYKIPKWIDHTDRHLVFSQFSENISREYGVENVIAVGKPGTDHWIPTNRPDNAIVVAIVSSAEPGMVSMALRLVSLLPPSCMVVYKKHPSEILSAEEEKALGSDPRLVVMDGNVNIHSLFGVARVVIGQYSTAVVEALSYEEMEVILYLNGQDPRELYTDWLRCYMEMIDRGEIVGAKTPEQIAERVIHIMRCGNSRKEIPYWADHPEERFLAQIGENSEYCVH
jgi:hypothetical protein